MKNDHLIKAWLLLVIAMIFSMVVIGGATRLTNSGLSITEWAPILGAIPPLNDASWTEAFEKYKLSSQFKLQNSLITMTEFQFIFWWEWAHRFVGRALGLAIALPLAYFAFKRTLSKNLWPKLSILFVLVAAQGALGWFMVASGLVDRVSVSQYRLAAHLTLASILLAWAVWTYLSFEVKHQCRFSKFSWLLVVAMLLQIGAGGFVAGLDAGMGYNTWPLMDGALVPSGLGAMQPLWLNVFENALTVQFDHRLLAYAIAILVLLNFWRKATLPAIALFALTGLQIILGIATLLLQVPLALALAHQATAMVVLAASVWNLHETRRA